MIVSIHVPFYFIASEVKARPESDESKNVINQILLGKFVFGGLCSFCLARESGWATAANGVGLPSNCNCNCVRGRWKGKILHMGKEPGKVSKLTCFIYGGDGERSQALSIHPSIPCHFVDFEEKVAFPWFPKSVVVSWSLSSLRRIPGFINKNTK